MKRALYLAAVAVVAVAGWLLLRTPGFGPAPDSTFVLLDGSRQSTADFRGRVVLVNFWATSCTACVAEMPKLMATYDKYRERGYDTVAVA
ncbi:MAG: TlpA disulfide reductase family protein, partial [Hylemonella sp.]